MVKLMILPFEQLFVLIKSYICSMEIVTSGFTFLMIAGIVLGAVFMFFSLRSRNGRAPSIVYLNLVVLFLSLNNLQICLVDNGLLEVNFFVRKMLIPWYMLILPAFYTFLMYYLKVDKKLYSVVRLSVLFFLVEVGVRIVMAGFFLHDDRSFVVARYSQFEEIFNAIFTIFLFVKSAILVFSYAEKFDYVTNFDNLRWLKNFIFLGCLVMLLWVVAILINLDHVVYPKIFVYYPMRLSCSIVLYWIAYQGFFNYRIMSDRIAIRAQFAEDLIEIKSIDEKHEDFSKREIAQQHFLEVENFMKNNLNYLQPDFSLIKLSALTGIPVNKISSAINICTDFNFSDYVSSYRVNWAKRIFNNSDYDTYDISSIGLECGFNSKSVFYKAFKKFTGQTPYQFKKSLA